MRRRTFLLTSALAPITFAYATRRARMVHLFFLENGHVRFDDGPELDLMQFRQQVRALKREEPRPDIALETNIRTKYEFVATVLKIFQEEAYGAHLGFTGIDQAN